MVVFPIFAVHTWWRCQTPIYTVQNRQRDPGSVCVRVIRAKPCPIETVCSKAHGLRSAASGGALTNSGQFAGKVLEIAVEVAALVLFSAAAPTGIVASQMTCGCGRNITFEEVVEKAHGSVALQDDVVVLTFKKELVLERLVGEAPEERSQTRIVHRLCKADVEIVGPLLGLHGEE